MNPHFSALEPAYQLHFYLCFKTRFLHPLLSGAAAQQLIHQTLADVCEREQYHLLESELSDDHLRLLVSLKPSQTVSHAVQMLKGNTQHQFSKHHTDELREYRAPTLWAKGYFGRSAGKVNLEVARNYVEAQVAHHGYRGSWTEALQFHNSNFKSPAFELAHCVCMLNYHIVLVTQERLPIFDEFIAPKLFEYVKAVGARHQFSVDRMSLLPDHLHLILEAVPSVCVEDCVTAILENSWYWMNKNYDGVLKQMNAWDVWQPSYYAGTVGEYTTAQVKRFLGSS